MIWAEGHAWQYTDQILVGSFDNSGAWIWTQLDLAPAQNRIASNMVSFLDSSNTSSIYEFGGFGWFDCAVSAGQPTLYSRESDE